MRYLEVFLYGFLVPILPSMLEQRLHVDPSETQRFTSISLALNGLASVFGGPLIGHFADKAQDRRTPLLVALFGCIIGTGMVACATSLAMLFAGRALQGVSGSGAWIVGIATAADTVSDDDFGKVMGFIMSCVNAGIITGPTVSGLIFETAGYWLTWSVPVVILIIDIVARLLMIETPRNSSAKGTETESLLSPQDSEHVPVERNFWSVMLTDIRVITALLICVWGASLNTSLSATIPLYVQRTFEWGPARTGQLFLLLAVPGLIIGPLVGWLRDRVGTRLPATFTIALQSMALAFLGLVTISHYNGDGVDMQGQALYITCIAMLGLFKPGLDGNGPVELTGELAIATLSGLQDLPLIYHSCREIEGGTDSWDIRTSGWIVTSFCYV